MLVQERARRSTAGNRMRDLLEQEFEAEEMFVEAENDVEFEEREGMSDFDGNSTEEDSAEDVEAEEVIAREEKQARRKVRTLILLTYLGDTSRCAISHLGVGSSRVGQTCYDAQATAPTYCS